MEYGLKNIKLKQLTFQLYSNNRINNQSASTVVQHYEEQNGKSILASYVILDPRRRNLNKVL